MDSEQPVDDLSFWLSRHYAAAFFGWLSFLLVFGKLLHFALTHRGAICGIARIPSSILSGMIGLCFDFILYRYDAELGANVEYGLQMVRKNVLSYIFAALILGLSCKSRATSSRHISAGAMGILGSIFHEGMPMLIYHQILSWGQTTMCLCLSLFLQLIRLKVPIYMSAMVPLGLEAESDIYPSRTPSGKYMWSHRVVEDSESLGLLSACALFVLFNSYRPYCISLITGKENLNDKFLSRSESMGTFGQAESFNRKGSAANNHSTGNPLKESKSSSRFDSDASLSDVQSEDVDNNFASLGNHVSLMALVVFIALVISYCLHVFEMKAIYNSLRLFKLSMFCALFTMHLIMRYTNLKFKRDWFMRLGGILLDLVIVGAISVANFRKPQDGLGNNFGNPGHHHRVYVLLYVSVCCFWHIICFVFIARYAFPNFWVDRALTLSGDALGHSYLGLLFARTLDPRMETPVPAAYAYKLMLFFVPSTGEKNTIIVSFMENHGNMFALVVCSLIVVAWLLICDRYFSSRFIKNPKYSSDSICSGLFFTWNAKDDSTDEHADPDSVRLLDSADEGNHTLKKRSSIQNKSTGDLEKFSINPTVSPVETEDRSSIISSSDLDLLASWIPERHRVRRWVLKYSLQRDGACLGTLLALTSSSSDFGVPSHSAAYIIVEDSWGYVFGGFVSQNIINSNQYYGNGESYVYSLQPQKKKYSASGDNSFFILSNGYSIAMGGGNGGYAFQLDDELDTGVSNCSATFSNPILSSNEFFKCLNVEVWTLEETSFSC